MKKLKPLAAILLICALVLAVFAACENNPNGETDDPSNPAVKIKVAVLKGPTGLGALQILDTPAEYDVTVASAPTEIPGLLTAGTVDIAALPLNLAATLYNKTSGNIVLLNVNTLGVLYLLERGGETVSSIADLKGKTVYASGQGATPEYVLNFLLEKNGLDPKKDVTIEWVADHAALSAKLLAGGANIAVLPEPNVTTATAKDSTVRVALDLNKAWADATDGGKLAMGCVVVRKEFLKDNPDAVSKFVEDYTSSVHFVNGNPVQAGTLAAKYEILPDAALAQKAIPNCQLVSITGNDMKTIAAENLKVLFDADAKSIGGALPKDAFYYGAG
ncbi:MAG: ABC transporter substrate-binding protein [Oscillospiraceae bacterium]|jgi:NitT/TauT family transport system substrate-binding protein|nr:ABC transporter substrate-binding protein [Oscillospiraceae bacterium]